MKILLFGATGRVGNSIALKALEKGYQIVAFVRNKNKVTINNPHLTLVEGDIYDKDALDKLKQVDFDLLINVIGADPLKPSTIFSDTTRLILELLSAKPGKRYLAITGIAQMDKTFFGRIVIGILKITPVKNAITDHQNAFEQVSASPIHWTLIGCPYIKDGIEKGFFKTDSKFRGGFKTIHPGDVATAIVQQIDKTDDHKIIGIWY
jgi:putative NADH-flavin reductase